MVESLKYLEDTRTSKLWAVDPASEIQWLLQMN